MSEPSERVCWQCGYSLQGLPDPRCPECGHGYDPNDPWSYAIGRAPYSWERPFLLEPPRSIWRLALFGAIALLIGDSAQGGYELLKVIGVLAWFVAGLRWAPRALVLGLYFRRTRSLAAAARLRPLAMTAGLVLVSAAMLKINVTLRLAFLVSRPALERLVQQPPGTRWFVGAFGATRRAEPGTVEVWWAGANGPAGFVHATTRPANTTELTFRRIARDWYTWRQDF